MATASSHVFVSYSRADEAAIDALVQALESRGISFRFDRDLVAGDEWQEKLRQWLNDAGAVLVVWSRHSASSVEVNSEATRARDRLVPVRLTGMAEVPGPFQDLQTLDLSAWRGDPGDPVLDQLDRALRAMLASSAIRGTADAPGGAAAGEQPPVPGDGTASQPGETGKPGPWYRRMPAWVGPAVIGPLIVGVILAFVSGWAGRITGSGSQAVPQQPVPTRSASQQKPGRASSSAPTPGAVSTQATVAPIGVITNPPAGATDIYQHEQLHVSGTARNLPKGCRLDVFLQFAGYQRYYIAADPDIAAPLINGHWSATIYIGDPGSIIIWLSCLSPAEIKIVNGEPADQSAGYPTLPGVMLDSVSFTANASP
jgi:hypothetical protein